MTDTSSQTDNIFAFLLALAIAIPAFLVKDQTMKPVFYALVLLPTLGMIQVAVTVSALVAAHWMLRTMRIENLAENVPAWGHRIAWAAMIGLLVLTQGGGNAFIYFQF